MVLVGSADQYLAGCWHSQESTKLCTRNDDDATDQDDGFDILGVTVLSRLSPLSSFTFYFVRLFPSREL